MNIFFYILKVLVIIYGIVAIIIGVDNILTVLVNKMFDENDDFLNFR